MVRVLIPRGSPPGRLRRPGITLTIFYRETSGRLKSAPSQARDAVASFLDAPRRPFGWGVQISLPPRRLACKELATCRRNHLARRQWHPFPEEDVGMYSVIRENFYDLKKLSNAEKQMQEFHSIHAAQRGYRGNIVVDLGAGRMLVVTLWESESLAHAARAALEPAIQRLLVPLMTKPSHLLGAGPVAVADLPK